MSVYRTEKNAKNDIDSKIADFMADIDEIVLGKKSNTTSEQSEWQQCFDETTRAVYYWNTKTNECSWDPPPNESTQKRSLTTVETQSPKKAKKPNLIAEYLSSESSEVEEEEQEEDGKNVDDIDELLEEVLEKEDKPEEKVPPVDLYPFFEADSRAAIARLIDLADRSTDALTLRIQLETRLEDCLFGHLSKSYAVSKLEAALVQIDQLEQLHLTKSEPSKSSLTTSEMALLLSLPPPPPPPSPPAPPSNEVNPPISTFYTLPNSDSEKTSHHHHSHKEKKSKPVKTLPTNLIQKWAHARQELRSTIPDLDDS